MSVSQHNWRYRQDNQGGWHYDPQPHDDEPAHIPGFTLFALGFATGVLTVMGWAFLSYLVCR